MGVVFPGPGETPRPYGGGSGDDESQVPLIESVTEKINLTAGPPTREEVESWLKVQVPYPNLAEDSEVAARALELVRTQKRYHADRTNEIHDKWRALDVLLRGNSLSRRFKHTDIHVPEVYKMVETIVPRIEEAIFQASGNSRSFFEVRGRDQMDKRKAWRIRAWLEYLLEAAGIEDYIQEAARCMVVYGFCAIKSWWEIDFQRSIERIHERMESKNGLPQTKITAKEVEKLMYYGPRYKLVDPYDFIVDTSCTNPQKGLFVGDVGEATFEDIAAKAELGWYTNHMDLLEQAPKQHDGTQRRWSKFMRSLDTDSQTHESRKAEGQPEVYEVVEMWVKWDPYGGHNAEEYVVTVANENVVLQVRKNFHDDRHRPYAVARSSREPFDFHNVGILDHAVRLNIEIDEHRNLALKSHENSLCPMVFGDMADDLPQNIFDVEPGEVFRTIRKPEFFMSPPTVDIMAKMDHVTRRDIEEVTGAPRIYEGTSGSSDTATGVVRKIEESNRRLKSVIRSFGGGLAQLLKHTHALSAQFTTRKETFRVMGALAANGKLGPHSDIGPEDLGLPIDFSITGIDSIHTLGLRGTNIATVMNQIYPIAAQFLPEGSVDWSRISQVLWDNTVGTVPGEEIFASDSMQADLVAPDLENLILAQGGEVAVQEGDQDQAHMATHLGFMASDAFDDLPSETKEKFLLHISHHEAQDGQKRAKAAAMERRRESMAQSQGQDGNGQAGKGRGPGREPDFAGDPSVAPPGQINGPGSQATVSAADRQSGITQDQNQTRV